MLERGRVLGFAAIAGLLAGVPCVGNTPDVFPLDTGAKRLYRLTKKESFTLDIPSGKQSFPMNATGVGVEQVTGTDSTLFGTPVSAMETRATQTDTHGDTHAATTTTYYSAKPDGIYLAGMKATAAQGEQPLPLAKYTPPLLWLKLPLQSGASWTVGKLKAEGVEMNTTARVVGTEDVTVPAGTYHDCWKVLYQHTQLTGTMKLRGATATTDSGQGTSTIWLAPGVGPVKEATELSAVYTIRPETTPDVVLKAELSVKKSRELTSVETPKL